VKRTLLRPPEPLRATFDALAPILSALRPPIRDVLGPLISDAASRGVFHDQRSGAAFAGASTDRGWGGFEVTLFPPLPAGRSAAYRKAMNMNIPVECERYLGQFNGATIFGLTLYGMDERVAFPGADPNDVGWFPRDITAERRIRQRQSRLSHGKDGHFEFAARLADPETRLSYWLEYPGFSRILAVLSTGQIVSSWDSVAAFLSDELKAAIVFYPEWRAGMATIVATNSAQRNHGG